ncbi:MAG: 16S rRNA (guanine(966)-N(2))-methyltransferase RsmD [Pseudohongiellaceae bacterium]
MKNTRNKFRIIAGTWRGRQLHFPDIPHLRPTTDRIRETLFNWLQLDIQGASCLDAFSGSGALSLEALSRGAGSVTSVDMSPEAIACQRYNCQLLGQTGLTLIQADTLQWLQQARPARPFDIAFLDPPYTLHCLQDCCELLEAGGWVGRNSKIYLESNQPLAELKLPGHWSWLKNKKAGQVYYGLCQRL